MMASAKEKKMKTLPTQAEVKEWLEYYEGNLYWRKSGKYGRERGKKFGVKNQRGYCVGSFNGRHMAVHRLIFFYHHRYWPKETDHINRDKTDNRIENLRECTSSQNSHNRVFKSNSVGYRGVYRKGRSFCARIQINGKQIHLGSFPTAALAATAYNTATTQHHGEFAVLNKIKKEPRYV